MKQIKQNEERTICACCRKDITEGYMVIWIHGEPLCYECAERRVKHEDQKNKTE